MRRIIVLDIETTGFSMNNDYIVEIGMCTLNLDNGKVKTIFDELIREKCFNDNCREAWIFNNSNLTYDEVCNGLPMSFCHGIIQLWLSKFPATAFNAPFDFNFLEHRGFKFKLLPDPMRILTPIMKLPRRGGGLKYPKVEEAWKYYFPDVEYIEEHRGADDAYHEAQIVYEMFKRGEFEIPIDTFEPVLEPGENLGVK